MERAYHYNICKDNSPDKFKKVCGILDVQLDGFSKEELVVDVDGSTIQIYAKSDLKVVVFDDYDIGAVFIESDIDLSEVLDYKEAVA